MSPRELADLELRIRERVEARLESGYALNDGHVYVEVSETCGCLLFHVGDVEDPGWLDDRHFAAADALQITAEDAAQIEHGYVAGSYGNRVVEADPSSPFYQIGARIRRDYYEIQGEVQS